MQRGPNASVGQGGAAAPAGQLQASASQGTQRQAGRLAPAVIDTVLAPPVKSAGSAASLRLAAAASMSPKDSFRMHQRRGSGALEDLLGGYSITVFADATHTDVTSVDVTDATSLADVHKAFGQAMGSTRHLVGLCFYELNKEYVCPLTLVLLYPSLFSERRNPGRVFWPLYQFPEAFATPPRRRSKGVATVRVAQANSDEDGEGQPGDSGGGDGAGSGTGVGRHAAAAAALAANASPLVGADGEPMEGRGRPLTAPPSDKTQGIARFRPTRREGHGRPLTAIPSDKTHGGRRLRPNRQEGHGRPASAAPSTLRGTGAAQWRVSPLGDLERTTTPASAGTGATDSDGAGANDARVPSPQRRRVAWADATVSVFDADASDEDDSKQSANQDTARNSRWGRDALDVDYGSPSRHSQELASPVALPEFRHSRQAGGVTTGFGASALDAVDLQADGGSHTLGQFIAQRQQAASVRPTSAPAGGRRTRGGVTRTGPGWRQRFGVQRDAWVVVSASASGDSSGGEDEETGTGATWQRSAAAHGSAGHESVSTSRRRSEDTPGMRDSGSNVARPHTAQGSPPPTSPRYYHGLASPLATSPQGAFPGGAAEYDDPRTSDDAEDAASDGSGDDFEAPSGSDSGDNGEGLHALASPLSWGAWRPTGTRHFGLGPL